MNRWQAGQALRRRPRAGRREPAGARGHVGKSVKLKLRKASGARSARKLVADGDVDLAVVAREGAGTPSAVVLVSEDASPTAQSVVALVPDALTRAAGGTPSARAGVSSVAPANQKPYEIIEQRARPCWSSSSCSWPSSR